MTRAPTSPLSVYARRALIMFTAALLCSSCAILTSSPYLKQKTAIPLLEEGQGLVTGRNGDLPYQRWRVPPWDDELCHVWLAGRHDFRKSDEVELVFYFHGMHSKDYYKDFQLELDALTEKRPDRPFVFIGFVDTPFVTEEARNARRWTGITPTRDEKPEKLFAVINRLYRAFKIRFPQMKAEKTRIALTGFSGGGKVLDSVTRWLAKSREDDPYARIFRRRLHKVVYFDCWFNKDVLDTVPNLLDGNPQVKIVGTVHMKKPAELAAIFADRYNMKPQSEKKRLVGLGGRLTIMHGDSHWHAMISTLRDAL